MQQEWFQIWVTIPIAGQQWAGWLYTTRVQALALSAAWQTCPGAQYTLLDQAGNEVSLLGGQLPFPFPV